MSTADADTPRPADSPGPSDESGAVPDGTGPRAGPGGDGEAPDTGAPRGCPFLVADAGGWRLDMPSRDHRCGAVSPAAVLAPEKQARLCLTAAHTTCATYLASMSARTERVGRAPVTRATRWGLARTTSVIEDPGGLGARVVALLLDRRRWPAIPAVILVGTLFVLALSGFSGGSPAATVSPARPSPTVTAGPTAPPSTTPSDGPTPDVTTPPATPAATSTPTGTPQPSASFRTYKVKSGDTLSAIAKRFGTTVSAIADLNGISDPSKLHIGQVLLIP